MKTIQPKLLKFIGKGQVTIPREWRIRLGMTSGHVKAFLRQGRIVIEALHDEPFPSWNVDKILLNEHCESDQRIIKKGREHYKKGDTDSFISTSDFLNGQF